MRNSDRILEGAGWTFSILKKFPLFLLSLSLNAFNQAYFSYERVGTSFHSSFRIHLASFAFELNSTWRKIHLHGFIVRKSVQGNKQGTYRNLIFPSFLDKRFSHFEKLRIVRPLFISFLLLLFLRKYIKIY